MRLLPYTDPDHLLAHQFLVEEAHLLDTGQFDRWFDLLTEDVTYRMPVRVTAVKAVDEATVQTMDHFDEDRHSLRLRVDRFASRYAWTEDPQSRVRHHITNVRTFAVDTEVGAATFVVDSAVLLFRSRGDRNPPDLLSAGRTDTLRGTPDGLRLAARVVQADESVLRTQNLAIFL
jgi:3-phenylpropionate/cinnamic acid dioxygenase small subunit